MTSEEHRIPLEAAVAAWHMAIEATHNDIARIARGGAPDAELTSQLLAAVEAARQHCEDQMALTPTST